MRAIESVGFVKGLYTNNLYNYTVNGTMVWLTFGSF